MTEMQKRDISTHLGHTMVGFEANKVKTEGGEFDADLILFMPGMTGNLWFDNSELPRSEGGLVKANQHCKVEGMDAVYVAGDSGSFPGPDWMPKQAHMADLQAECAAKNLVSELLGQKADETFKIELMCIVDSCDKGLFVSRTENKNTVWPANKAMHWAKRGFEWWYLRHYR
jgi:sulfide:quinone oxidoreductase